MAVLVYESVCASGDAASPLRAEGWAMLAAVVADFRAWEGGPEVWTILDPYCPHVEAPPTGGAQSLRSRCWRAKDPRREPELFRRLAAEAEATLVIAPETGGILSQRSRWVEEAGGRLLGSLPHAIALTADKHALAAHWRRHDVPTPPATLVSEGAAPMGFPAVLKPRDGAGSQATFLVGNQRELVRSLALARQEMPAADFLVQPFVPGLAASVAFLLASDQIVALAPTAQHLSDDGRFHYLGGTLPLDAGWAARAVALGRRAVECVAGLQGFVGVDLVLGTTADTDAAIEINPRLTTSYLGLRRLARCNLTEFWWRMWAKRSTPPLCWAESPVTFAP